MSFLIKPDALAVATIWQEAQGEMYQGKVAVGEVIRERMRRGYFSDGTVASTVLWPWQFSGWNTGGDLRVRSCKIDDLNPVVIDCIRAWNESEKTRFTKGAVLYCNLSIATPNWAKEEKRVAVIGNHTFFRD